MSIPPPPPPHSVLFSAGRIFQPLRVKLQRRFGLRHIWQIDPRLARKELVFHAPPLTTDLFDAIKWISPQSRFTRTEKGRQVWETDQNAACWGEYEALAPLFDNLDSLPKLILELGPGMGRSIVFFNKIWKDVEIHAYEGNGTAPVYPYPTLGPREDESFYGNIQVLRHVLDFNNVHNATVFDAKDIKIPELPGPYDFIYSFHSVGLHWDLAHFLTDILMQMHDHSIAVFMLSPKFRPFPELRSLPHSILDCKLAWPKDGWIKLLVLGKTGSVSERLAKLGGRGHHRRIPAYR